jgi:hypothetical protein
VLLRTPSRPAPFLGVPLWNSNFSKSSEVNWRNHFSAEIIASQMRTLWICEAMRAQQKRNLFLSLHNITCIYKPQCLWSNLKQTQQIPQRWRGVGRKRWTKKFYYK